MFQEVLKQLGLKPAKTPAVTGPNTDTIQPIQIVNPDGTALNLQDLEQSEEPNTSQSGLLRTESTDEILGTDQAYEDFKSREKFSDIRTQLIRPGKDEKSVYQQALAQLQDRSRETPVKLPVPTIPNTPTPTPKADIPKRQFRSTAPLLTYIHAYFNVRKPFEEISSAISRCKKQNAVLPHIIYVHALTFARLDQQMYDINRNGLGDTFPYNYGDKEIPITIKVAESYHQNGETIQMTKNVVVCVCEDRNAK